MTEITEISMNYSPLRGPARCRITEGNPVFSWAAAADHSEAFQTAYRLEVLCGSRSLWDTGWVETDAQSASYAGGVLPAERKLVVRVAVRDDRGGESRPKEEAFFVSGLADHVPDWIAAAEDKPGEAVYFRRDFRLGGKVESAVLYACGLGYHRLFLNGELLDGARLDPVFSDYTKSCYYVMLPEIGERLRPGENCLCVVLGEGWRRNEGILFPNRDLKVPFFGRPQLSASLRVRYADGRCETIDTDETWRWTRGAISYNNLFNGETYDAGRAVAGWNLPGSPPAGLLPAQAVPAPGGAARVMTVEPVAEHEVYAPLTVTPVDGRTRVVDFGQNIAGVCRVRLPKPMRRGQAVTIEHMETLDEDGRLYLAPLRGAKCRDTYIASGDGRDPDFWQPAFTYHGFRYAQVTGLPLLEKDDIRAVSLYTDVPQGGFFSCGSALVNAIQKNVVQTEKSNLMGILTDCPQRDERLGWMNDATVRFEETPYNFGVGRLFPKVVQDLLDAQSEDGAITCTAPFLFGGRPADPVCSSFLIAGLEACMHTGNLEILRRAYGGFAAWEKCLAAHSSGCIVDYSYYGDWAAPVYACVGGDKDVDAVQSLGTPGILMSTGYFYYNAVLLSRFAALLGWRDEKEKYAALAEKIRQAMLAKWWDGKIGRMATGSQGCQSFALWLGILPEEGRRLAARRLHEDLEEKEYRITTGNLCTRYLMDVLTEYGYVDDAWRIVTREEYPSFGYMIQNEATTVWERFEMKKSPGMNSHNHPMYGAVGYWFYAYLAGIRPTAPGFSEAEIRPFFPEKLLSVNASVHTCRGDLTVRWIKRYGRLHLYVTVPFGTRARIVFAGEEHDVGSGFWSYHADLKA